jgi:hypothetical protein
MTYTGLMRLTLSLILFLWTISAYAQEPVSSYYVFGGAGGSVSTFRSTSSSLFHVGGGGEFASSRGLGVGAELGYLGPWSNGSNGVGLFSLNGLYRFTPTPTQFFVTGGYSLGFRTNAASFGNIGIGVNVGPASGLGLRLELRDHIRDGSEQWIIGRVGIVLR